MVADGGDRWPCNTCPQHANLKTDLDYIRGRVDEIVSMYSGTQATVRTHGMAIKWLFGIVASVVVVLVAYAVGAK